MYPFASRESVPFHSILQPEAFCNASPAAGDSGYYDHRPHHTSQRLALHCVSACWQHLGEPTAGVASHLPYEQDFERSAFSDALRH